MTDHCQCSVTVRDVCVKKGGELLLDHVSFTVRHGEVAALLGRNGAGKTTLLKALLGRIPYTGEISFHGPDGAAIAKPRIGYVPQNMSFARSSPVTAADLLCARMGRRPVWLGHGKRRLEKAASLLAAVGAGPELLEKRLGSLSGGELQRVLLAFALAPQPDLLLLDEPVSAVDRKGAGVFYSLISAMRREHDMPVLLVSHDLAHVEDAATRAILLDRRVVCSGPAAEVMKSAALREAFGLPKGGA